MASGALRELGGELGRLDNNAGIASRGIGGLQTAVRTGLVAAAGMAVTGVGALGAGMVLAANKAGDFESQINILGVAASSTGTSMEDLSAAALAVGSDSDLVGISASQAADAMTNFYRAGLTTTDVFGDLQGYLAGTTPLTGALRSAIDLAAASELDLAQASDVVSVAMATFGLGAGDAATIANSLVGAADASVASVGGLSDALVNVGPVAASMGMSLNDTNIALALLSTRGIQGSEAGTALRSMLLHLQSGTPAVTAALDALNVSLYDQQGNMLPLPNIIGQLQTAFGGLTQEQQNQYAQTLAGTYGLGALNTLVGEGLPGWDAMATAVANAASAQEVAGARTQGFNAAMEQLGGVIETFLISVGTPLIENFLTPGVQALGEWIGNLTTMIPTTEGVSTAFQTLLGYGQQVLTWLGNTLGPVLELVGQFVSWQDVLIVLGGVITSVLIAGLAGIVSAAAPVLLAFGALVLAVGLVRTAWETDFGGIRTFVEGVVATISGILGGLSTYIQTNSAEATGWITQAWTQIQTFIGTAVAAIDGIVRGILGPIQSFLQTHSTEIQGFLITAWETIGSIVTGVLEVLQLTVGAALTAIAGFLQTHSAEIEAIISTVWTVISSIIQGTLNTINGIVQTALAILRGDWDGAWAALQGIVQTQLDTVRTVVETVLGPIATWIAGKLEEIRGWFETKWAAVKTAVESKIAEIRQAIETWLTNTLNTIQNFDLGAAARALFEKVVTGIAAKAGEALARVATFLDNAFLAIESFDLQAAAQTFFGTTLPGIAAKAGEALNKVGEWLSRVGSDIAAKDLEGQAKSWFGTVVPGILAKATEALSKVGEWLSQTAQKISQFDLLAAAKTLFGTIIPGLMAKAGEILSKLGDVLNNLASRIREKSFKSETMTAIATVVSGIVAKVGDVLQSIGTMLTSVSNAISNFSLADVGRALIQGLVGGIQSMAGALVSAAQGVVQGAIDAARNLLGISSPSRVFHEIGEETMLGFSGGLQSMAGTVVTAMSQIMGDVSLEALERGADIADAVGSIVDTMTSLIEAAGALAAFEVPAGLSAAIDAIAVEIGYVIDVFLDTVAQFEADAVSAAADFADDAGSVLDVFSSGVDLIAQLANYTEVNIGPAASNLATQIGILTSELARVANEIGPAALAAAAASGALFEDAMAPWQAGVDAVAAIATYTGVVIGPAAEQIVLQMQGLAQKLARVANEIGPDTLAQAATAAGQLETITGLWEPAIDNLAVLGAYVPTVIGPTAQIIVDQIRGLANKFRQLQGDLSDIGGLTAFIGQVDTLIQRIYGVVQQMNALAQGLGEPIDLFASGYTTGYDWVRGIVAGINNRLPSLQAVLDYIRGLFPSSPAKYGPWRKLPKGAVVGSAFSRDLATGLGAEADRVTKAMRKLRDNVTLSSSLSPALSSGGVRGYPTPDVTMDPFSRGGNGFGFAPSRRPPVMVTISNNTFGSRQDIDYLMDEMERRLELQGAFRL